MKRRKIECLTSLRFIAATMIVIHHSRGVLWLSPSSFDSPALDQAVSFFFVLSGFILTYSYPTLSGRSEVKRFLVARFARIWPVHAAGFIGLFLVFLPYSALYITQGDQPYIAMLNLSLLHAWVPLRDVFFSFNAVSWAISVEAFFYLMFPYLIKQFASTWIQKLVFSALIVVGVVVACHVLKVPGEASQVAGTSVSRSAILYINPLVRLFEFVLGMCTALIWMTSFSKLRLSRGTATLLELLAICIVSGSIYQRSFVTTLDRSWLAAAEYIVHSGSSILFSGLIAIVALEKGLVSHMLSFRIPVVLGELSYSIFVFHQVILRVYTTKAQQFSFLPEPLLYLCFWISLLAGSFLVWLWIEIPCRRFIVGLREW